MTCNDPNPWDNDFRCQLDLGHTGLHRDPDAVQAWDDRSHWPADDCQPCTNPRRSA